MPAVRNPRTCRGHTSDRGSSMHTVFSLLPQVAAILAVPQFLPQLARRRRGVGYSQSLLSGRRSPAPPPQTLWLLARKLAAP